MASSNNGKLLILDGIGGVPLGREIHRACAAVGVGASHHDCAEFPRIPLYGLRSAWAKAVNRRERGTSDSFFHLPRLARAAVEEAIRREAPAVVLVVGFVYKFIDPAFLLALKREFGFSLALYDTDSCNLYGKRREFVFFIENELPIYDRILSFSRVTTDFFRNTRGFDAAYFPFGASPIDMPAASAHVHDVLFVGSADLRRIFLLEHIRDRVSVFGSRWQRNYPLISAGLKARITDRAVWGEELHRHFADAKIVLNITRAPFYAAETGINLRIFEALAAGAFLLTDYCDEVAELFTPGIELEMFRSSSELAEKVAYYLENDDARAAVARRGHARFLAEFTWERRTAEMLERLGLRGATAEGPREQAQATGAPHG